MYERNAIVLERYFNDLFKYGKASNIKENYRNYCDLIENLEKYNIATENESSATFDFDNATANIRKIQKNGEKLYNKSAKLEYSRYIVYENIEEKSEDISNCLSKIENDVEKNNEALKILDEEFKSSSDNYKEKKSKLAKCQKENKEAKQAYEKSLRKAKEIFEGIFTSDIEIARDFLVAENRDKKKELNTILNENGKSEKNPFDVDVISTAVENSFNIYTKEIELLLNAYERTKKLLSEIQENDVKMDKHKKLIRDTNVKLHFLSAQKDYIFGFLDNERIAAIYDKKIHRKLMLEACRNLESDMIHINNMYDIILKEAAGRASKRLYKDNYNINYLDDIEKVAEGVNEETNKLKANAVAVMNLNYWRIDGITRIQDVFEEDMLKTYERDIAEIFPEKRGNSEEAEEQDKQEKQEKTEKEKTSSRKILRYKKIKSPKSVEENIVSNNEEPKEKIEEKTKIKEEKNEEIEKTKKVKKTEEIKEKEEAVVVEPEELEEPEIDIAAALEKLEEITDENEEDNKILEKNNDSIETEENVESEEIEELIDDIEEEFEYEDEDEDDAENYEEESDDEIIEEDEDEEEFVDDAEDEEYEDEFDEDYELDEEDDEAETETTKFENEEESQSLFEKISMLDEMEDDLFIQDKSLEDEEEEDSIIDFYFSNANQAEKKRKSRDEKKLSKDDKKENIFKKLLSSNARNKKEA